MSFDISDIPDECMVLFFGLFLLDERKVSLKVNELTEVFVVEEIISKKKMVFKTIKIKDKKVEKIKKDLQKLIEISSACKFLVKLKKFFITDNNDVCIVMEYCSRGNLKEKLSKGTRILQPVFIYFHFFFFSYINV
jgi:serine/threonine protein kinase